MPVAISIDAMGGDHAPGEVVKGAVRAAKELEDIELHLVGIEAAISRELDVAGFAGSNIHVVPAKQVIAMGDSPVEALRRKRGSSIEEAVKLVRDGRTGAFVSAGNTGACVAAAQLFLGLLPSVKRAGILVSLCTSDRPVCVMDVGANIAAKPEHLIQYGVMASLYARQILEVESPRVGLLNIGEEDEKGNRLVRLTRGLFEETDLNFVGNIEGAEVFRGGCEVVVCDGFTGNIVLKVSEGLAEQLVGLFKSVLERSVQEISMPVAAGVSEALAASPSGESRGAGAAGSETSRALGDVIRRSLRDLECKLDYSEYGGAPLLGVDGVAIMAHGRSDAKAIYNAIRVAQRMVEVQLNRHITEQVD